MSTQHYSYSQSQNIPQPTSSSVNFIDQPRSSQNKVKITHFFNKIKIIQIDNILEINLFILQLIIFHQMMKITIIKIINEFIQAKDLVLTVLTNQIFLNHTHEMNKYDDPEIIYPELKCIKNLTAILITTTWNNKKSTYKLSSDAKCRRITANDYEPILHGWIINIIE